MDKVAELLFLLVAYKINIEFYVLKLIDSKYSSLYVINKVLLL